MKIQIIQSAFVILCTASTLLPAVAAPVNVGADKTALQYIADFRRGEDFKSNYPVKQLSQNGRIDQTTLSVLTRELAVGKTQVRENIVKLLQAIGLEMDTPRPDKYPVIRDRSIIRALLVEGFAKDDGAADAAAHVLREQCMPSDLAAFNDIYVQSLRQFKGDYLTIATKAKTAGARPFVDRMATMPAWREHGDFIQIVRIAQAALGNTAVEDKFIKATRDAEKNAPPAPKNRFYDIGPVRDGAQLAAALGNLGLIGTRRSLQVACSYLRSPMKAYIPDIQERSIRHDALDAIHYNFPEERVRDSLTTATEWAEAEKFCTQKLGAVFVGPTPDLPQDQAYPTRMLPGH